MQKLLKFNMAFVCALLLIIQILGTAFAVSDTTEQTAEEEEQEDLATEAEDEFSDVNSSDWYASYIDEDWTGNCDANGKNCKFDGDGVVTKIQAAKLIMSVLNKRNIKQIANSDACLKGYKDATTGQWYGRYVCAAIEMGIIKGQDKETLGSGGLNRITALELLLRALGGKQFLSDLYEGPFAKTCTMPIWTDAPTKDDWFYDTARIGACMGLISGIPNDDGSYRLGASEALNRAQFAKLFHISKLYNTDAFYTETPGVNGENTYLILSAYDGKKIESCTAGPDIHSISWTVDGVAQYFKSAVAFMLHNDLRCNAGHKNLGMITKSTESSSVNKFVSIGNASYIVIDMGVDIKDIDSLTIDVLDDENYNLFVADMPASPDTWIKLAGNLTGKQTLENSDLIQ
jgi:hypothetical protein